MRTLRPLLLMCLSFLLLTPLMTTAQEPFGETPEDFVFKGLHSSCYVYKKYVVLVEERTDEAGELITVLRAPPDMKKSRLCVPEKSRIISLDLPGAEYFFGLYKDLLLVDSGTTPARALYLFNLASGKPIVEADYVDSIEQKGKRLIFWSYLMDRSNNQFLCPKPKTGDSCQKRFRSCLKKIKKPGFRILETNCDEGHCRFFNTLIAEKTIDLETAQVSYTGRIHCGFAE